MNDYETLYNKIVESHKDGDREVNYKITGKQTITLEQDLDGLDKAFERCINDLNGFITAKQTNKQITAGRIYNDADYFNKNKGLPVPGFENPESIFGLDHNYFDDVKSIMKTAVNEFLKAVNTGRYYKGMGQNNLEILMGKDELFIEN